MPDFNEFHINQSLLDEVNRLKNNQTKQFILPIKIPSRVRTIPPDERLNIVDWYAYLRERKIKMKKDLEVIK